MAHITRTMTLKLQTTKDGELEEVAFAAGDAVTVVHQWEHFYLIKDADGHFYNIAKDALEGV